MKTTASSAPSSPVQVPLLQPAKLEMNLRKLGDEASSVNSEDLTTTSTTAGQASPVAVSGEVYNVAVEGDDDKDFTSPEDVKRNNTTTVLARPRSLGGTETDSSTTPRPKKRKG
ncbi:unnamed protein product, partial [Amoebophrya sp. A120]|eukprot:GSA120T00014632001.1